MTVKAKDGYEKSWRQKERKSRKEDRTKIIGKIKERQRERERARERERDNGENAIKLKLI